MLSDLLCAKDFGGGHWDSEANRVGVVLALQLPMFRLTLQFTS